MGMLTTRYDVGDYVIIKNPGIRSQITSIRITPFATLYICTYWRDGVAEHYEAYDFEIESVDNG